MVVRTQQNGREVVGLKVGAANVRRHFPKTVSAIKLRLGDLEIECKLSPEFWNGKPEIDDPRLCEWLQYRRSQESTGVQASTLAMRHEGGDAYTLQEIPPIPF